MHFLMVFKYTTRTIFVNASSNVIYVEEFKKTRLWKAMSILVAIYKALEQGKEKTLNITS